MSKRFTENLPPRKPDSSVFNDAVLQVEKLSGIEVHNGHMLLSLSDAPRTHLPAIRTLIAIAASDVHVQEGLDTIHTLQKYAHHDAGHTVSLPAPPAGMKRSEYMIAIQNALGNVRRDLLATLRQAKTKESATHNYIPVSDQHEAEVKAAQLDILANAHGIADQVHAGAYVWEDGKKAGIMISKQAARVVLENELWHGSYAEHARTGTLASWYMGI